MKLYCPNNIANLRRKNHEPNQEWIGKWHFKAIDCKYKEYERRLKEQFSNGLDDKNIIAEIMKELTALKDTSEVSSEQILMWDHRADAQEAQREVLDNIRDPEEFESVQRNRQNNNSNNRQ